MKLSIHAKNWLVSAHVGFAATWTGTVLSMLLLTSKNMNSAQGEALHTLNAAITWLDDWIVIPSAIGSVITATLLCWLTNYGFTKFYWVITKWVLTTGLIIFGTFWLFPWSNTAAQISGQEGLQALQNSVYRFDVRGVLIGSILQIVFLLVIIGISVLKPWGRRPIPAQNQASSNT
uniref:Integral membrane protein n=1 Tax=Cyanothece sp. (strain PCC 7425 / ATCC 29141) TaxID=395961 RepID=B8HL65_CYAP4